MKYLIYLTTTVILLALFSSCEKDPSENGSDGDGSLSVQFRTWSNYDAPATKSSKNTKSLMSSTLLDVYSYKYEIKFTTDKIMSGINDSDINWVTVYESNELKKDSERDFEFILPPGEYRGFAVLHSCDFHWICDNNGVEMPITLSNCSEYNNFSNSEEKVYNIFGADGIYDVDGNGILQHVPDAGEHMGVTFNIYEGRKTTLTVRVNLLEVEWKDNDGDGTWSEGDEVVNVTLPDGVITMTDFIPEYE